MQGPEEEVEAKVKRPVGRPKKKKAEGIDDEEKKLYEMLELLKVIEDDTGLVKVNTDAAGEQEKPSGAAGEEEKPSENKLKSAVERLSKGIHELYKALSPGKNQATSLPIQDEDQNEKDEGAPKQGKG